MSEQENDMGTRILAYRARYNLSQQDFANRAKLSIMTVNAIENGKRKPAKLSRAKIEKVLKGEPENEVCM